MGRRRENLEEEPVDGDHVADQEKGRTDTDRTITFDCRKDIKPAGCEGILKAMNI
jgi:hypothetical protein